MADLNQHSELLDLLELLIEERISSQQFARLEELIRSDVSARRLYVEYMDLHGMLHWNTAASSDRFLPEDAEFVCELATDHAAPSVPTNRYRTRGLAVAAACLIAAVGTLLWMQPPGQLANTDRPSIPLEVDSNNQPATANSNDLAANSMQSGDGHVSGSPIELKSTQDSKANDETLTAKNENSTAVVKNEGNSASGLPGDSNSDVVAYLNEQLRLSWADNEIKPSPRADDAEWLRRAYLDTVGHIPSADQVKAFLADKRPEKRKLLVDKLLDDEDYVRNWTTVWTNLLIGRSNPREVNRGSLEKFLRNSFRKNRGWDDVVADVISAEGSPEENGAANFLMAHLNNQAVPATAITAKLFLCQQVQCTQCHDHPFNDRRQDEFWSFNSIFKEVKVLDRPRADNPKLSEKVLANVRLDGPTYYETRNGVMKATYPQFEGTRITSDGQHDLRSELAKLMTEGDAPQIARAFVNRMWLHFLGAAFTAQVDDMGPHARISHPQIVDRLTREFVRSGYDMKQLIRWITQSEPYQLSSRITNDNSVDDPATGNEALFSRAYVKTMTVEQVFDSLLIATEARELFGSSWEAVEKKRSEWLQQFVVAFGTDENDESDLFEGSIPQALMLMNGELVQLAIQNKRGTYLEKIAHSKQTDDAKIESIALATLSRKPTPQELAAVRKLIREHAAQKRGADASTATALGLQDLFWAYLNSNEFILIH